MEDKRMNTAKRKKLEAAGWKVGTAEQFLKLSSQETELVEIKLALSARLKQFRTKHHLSQVALAKRLGSSQSRVAKMEAGDPSVSLDLLVRALLVAGAQKKEVAKAMAG
jgi:DNA-binding XRE family transcriptional regulator